VRATSRTVEHEEENSVAETRLTAEQIGLVFAVNKGLGRFFPKTSALIAEHKELTHRAERAKDFEPRVDERGRLQDPIAVEVERQAIARQVYAEVLEPEAAMRQLEAAEKRIATERKAAALTEFEIARTRGLIVRTFGEETKAAWRAMVSAFNAARSEFEKAIENIPEKVVDDRSARQAGPLIAQLWLRAHAVSDEMHSLWGLAASLRGKGVFSELPHSHPRDFMWGAPSLVPSSKGTARPISMRRAIAAGANPRLLDAAAVRERFNREAAERKAENAARRPSGTSYGVSDPHRAVVEAIAAAEAAG
jgi:hypothetical protein